MKKRLALIVFFLITLTFLAMATPPFYYSGIETPDKTISFTIGFYPDKYSWHETPSAGKYSVIIGAIINSKNAQQIVWKDYKIYIMLKDGTLFNNYTTVAKDGPFACNYTVNPGETHYQNFTFKKKFNPKDIAAVWLKLSDSNFIKLLYKE